MPNAARVIGLSTNRQSSHLLVNCHDRAIRLFDVAPRLQHGQQGGGAAGWDEAGVRQRLAGLDFKVREG